MAIEEKIKNSFSKISKMINDHPLISAILICMLFFLMAMIFCDPRYEYNDDSGIELLLSGNYTGSYDPHMPFSNIILGYMLVGLYTLIPRISFYFFALEFFGLVSSIIIVWLLLKHCRTSIGILASVILLICYSDDLFILLQFTKTASAAIAAGGFLFLEGIMNKKLSHRKAAAVIGGIVFLFGTMLRFDCIYCVVPFLLVRFIFHIIKKPASFFITRFLLCLALICSAFALEGANDALWKIDPEYKAFLEYDAVRPSIVDVPTPEYVEIQPELEQLGISEVDYYMATTLGFTDMSVFTQEKLTGLAEILKDYNKANTNNFSHAIRVLGNRNYWVYPGVLGIILIAAILAFSERKSIITICAAVLVCFMLLLYFGYIGRVMYRVEFGVFLSTFLTMALALGNDPRKLAVRKIFYYGSLGAMLIVLILYHLGIYIPDTSYKTMDDAAYIQRCDSVFGSAGYYMACYNMVVSERRPHEELLTIIENDDSHFYLIDPHAMLDSNLDYKPWIRPDNSRAGEQRHFIGGWLMMQYPGENYVYEHNGIDPVDPYKSLINDNIYLVDNSYYGLKLAYIREHYYPDAQIAVVGEASSCKIWKIYIPEQDGN